MICFERARQRYYQNLASRNIPGAAWFRHQAEQGGIGRTSGVVPQSQQFGSGDIERTYALFTGGRALSENLQLDRLVPPAGQDESPVGVDSIAGITVREFDWTGLVKDLKPELDPLAAKMPADQHAVFFPDFSAAVDVADQIVRQGTVFLRLAEPRSEDGRTIARYERQLGLSLDGAVVVTNSLYQLGRLSSAGQGGSPSLTSLPEYTFFRDRYRRGEPKTGPAIPPALAELKRGDFGLSFEHDGLRARVSLQR